MRGRDSERGFTLAGLLVILTVLAVVVAYTVPPAWSLVMKREREKQTVWVMRQYARAIYEFQRKRNALPVSLDQLKEQSNPRVLRALYPNPLTGEMDWVLVPPGTAAGGMPAPGMPPPPAPGLPPPSQPTIAQPGQSTPGGNPKDYRGPFVGVRPSQTGEAYIQLNGADRYESWVYTVVELQQEIARAGGVPQTVPKPKPNQ